MMESMARESWTDERLGDLNGRVEEGFRRVDQDIRDLRNEFASLRSEMNARFDALQRAMLQGFVVMSGAMLTGFGGLAALIATQL